MNLGQMMVDDW